MKEIYFELIMMLERLHRLSFEMMKVELDRLGIKDLNNVQAIVLYNIGENQLTIGEISNKGYYLGSNVSYNLKKMLAGGYIVQEPAPHDKRSSQVRLTPKGLDLLANLDEAVQQQVQSLAINGLQEGQLRMLFTQGHHLENILSHLLLHKLRF